jgi:drug/metabolite transporter (DMT)-like permease
MPALIRLLKQPPVLIASAMVMWIVTEVAAARLFGRETSIPQIVWLRYAFHLVLMVAVLGIPRRFDFVRTQRPWLQLFRSLLMLVMPLSFAVAQGEAGRHAWGLFWTAPVMVLAFSALAGDTPPRAAWITTLLAWLGITAIYRPSLQALGLGIVPALVMAASFAWYVVLTRVLDRTESLLSNLFYSAISVFVVLSIALPWFWHPVGPRDLVGGIVVAVCGWVVLCLLDLGVRRESPTLLAPFLFVQAAVDILLRYGVRAFLDPSVVAPLVLTFGAVSIAWWVRRTPAAPPAPHVLEHISSR